MVLPIVLPWKDAQENIPYQVQTHKECSSPIPSGTVKDNMDFSSPDKNYDYQKIRSRVERVGSVDVNSTGEPVNVIAITIVEDQSDNSVSVETLSKKYCEMCGKQSCSKQ